MRRLPLAFAALLLAGTAHASDLTLRRVMLSTGGVGYFEYEADADGPATLGLDVPLAQVDDVLASLVVFDSAGGVGGLDLPGLDANHAAFADVPFGPQSLGSALDYLNSLQGVVLEVKGPRPMTGRLLRAERVREGAAPTPTAPDSGIWHTRVTLLTAAGLGQFVLEDAESVQVSDPDLRGRIDRALGTLRGEAAHDARHLSLRSAGAGPRKVRVGFVAGAPLWKATYRLVLPAKEGDKARLQGWAVLENVSATDWNNVDLSLQYGNPVTFRQALYRSYYVQRPEVPVEVLGRILPGVDSGALQNTLDQERARGGSARMMMAKAMPPPPPPSAAPAPAAMAADAAEPMAAPEEQTTTTEAAEATVFHLPTPVVLPAGHSAAVPILDREVPAERLGVVQQGRPHPLQALRITNDSGSSLPAGVLTLYDPLEAATFAGDARLGGLPSGDNRLLEFAEDLRTKVDWQTDEGTTLVGVTASQGVLHIQRRDRWTARIALSAPAAESRHLLIEIPRSSDATLLPEGDIKSAEETATSWRLPITLKPGEQRTLVVRVDRPEREDVELLQDNGTVAAILNEQALTPTARAALRHIEESRATLAALQADQARLKAQIAEVEHDEDRLRRNIATVPAADALHGKLVRALEADEEKLSSLTAAATQAEATTTQAQAALEGAVGSLRLDK
jgi:hypothetical protein